MVWQVSTESGEYRIQNNKSNSYGGTFIDYFTVKESGNVGINNGNPEYILDVKGDTYIDGIIYTSNILGNEHINTNNILKINYEEGEINSNLLYVYGDSTFYGKIGIGVTEPENSLDIIGNIKCDQIDAIGSNITLINTCNITDGILPVIRGGIGIDTIKPLQLVYGGINKIEQSSSLYWNNGAGTLNAPKFKGNGSEISSLDATNISAGTLSVSRGGTGRNNFSIGGGIVVGNFFGNNQYNISQTEALKWNNTDGALHVTGDIILPAGSNILIDGVPLKFDDFNSFPSASSNVKGMVKIFEGDFKFNDSNQLILAKQGSSKWGREGNKIWYPVGETPEPTHCVGIGNIPETDAYRLDVDGDINTSNGVFRINGINVIEENSNFISNRINTFTLDNIAVPPLIDELQTQNGGWYNKFFSLRDIVLDSGAQDKEFFISATPENYRFTFDNPLILKSDLIVEGSFTLDNPDGYINFSSLRLQRAHTESILIVNQTYSSTDDDTIEGSIVNFQKASQTHFRINRDGNLGIGRSVLLDFNETTGGTSIEPVEKLHVIGNIVATGFITAYYSDKRLKEFISNIENPLSIIDNLHGYFYKANKLAIENGFTDERNIGLSAQDVQKVLPELVKLAPFDTIKNKNGEAVSKSGNNYLTVCYEKLAPVFVEAIKELNNQVSEIKNENELLKKENKEIKEDIIKIKEALGINQ
jgi:hypothetical protein